MRTALKNVSLLIALVVVVYLIGNYSGVAKSQVMGFFNIAGSSVKGASTQKAEEVSEELKSDIATQLGILQEHALNVTLGDVMTTLSRLQQIPQDFQTLKTYTEEQVNNMIESRR